MGTKLKLAILRGAMICVFLTAGVAGADPNPGSTLGQMQAFSEAFASVAEKVRPTVVTIHSDVVVKPSAEERYHQYFFGMPNSEREKRRHSLGSGVVISETGKVLTNNHVVEGADRIRVELSDGRLLSAHVLGTDPKSDLAVLNVEGERLPAATLGDSDDLRVGSWVLAIGNPFGLQHTVTYGIVSAVGRGRVGLAEYEDFIQTDAAINPGNSGGALVDLAGRLVGINTAIISRSGGYQGIGFAIPVNMAMEIADQLIADGKVRRGWLGVRIQDITEEVGEALGLKNQTGALVVGVEPGGPAAGRLRRGDVIVSVDRSGVENASELKNLIANAGPDATPRVRVLRDGKELDLTIQLAEVDQVQSGSVIAELEDALGWAVQLPTEELASRLGYMGRQGMLITEVASAGPAADAGLAKGDLITELNRRQIRGYDDYMGVVSRLSSGDKVLVLAFRGQQAFYTAVRVPNISDRHR